MAVAEWRKTDEGLRPFVEGVDVVWAPQPGSQPAFLFCPFQEALLEGNKGGGKSDVLLMDFAQDVGKGFGSDWRGVLFRQTFPQLREIIQKSQKWFPRLWPGVNYNQGKHVWTWPDGESLQFSYMHGESDYLNHWGHEYPWIGWEELTTWPTPYLYLKMFGCLRSSRKGMPRRVRANTNPYGVGHNWVKARFKLPVPPGRRLGHVIETTFVDEHGEEHQFQRCAVRSRLDENKVFLEASPGYIQQVADMTSNPSEYKAWVEGSWDIVAGGMFDDVWEPSVHVIPAFEPPSSWYLDRSYDWGSSSPFSVGWWIESDGTVAPNGMWTRRGDVFRCREWYGWNGAVNEGLRMTDPEIARGILGREREWFGDRRPRPGPADNQIFAKMGRASIADEMQSCGVRWTESDKSPGSRKMGWSKMRAMLKAARDPRREEPGLFVFDTCEHFIRTIPELPRCDRDLDDIPKEAEDHVADETRYRLFNRRLKMSTKKRRRF